MSLSRAQARVSARECSRASSANNEHFKWHADLQHSISSINRAQRARCVIYAHSWNDDGEHTRLFLSLSVVSKYLINTQRATHLASRIEWVELCVACWVARDRFWNGFFCCEAEIDVVVKKKRNRSLWLQLTALDGDDDGETNWNI